MSINGNDVETFPLNNKTSKDKKCINHVQESRIILTYDAL